MERKSKLLNRVAQAGVVLLGIIAIVGSGGGAVGFPKIDYKYNPGTMPPSVVVSPSRQVVQAGTAATFEALVVFPNGPVGYQWRRGGVDIAGATAPKYTLNGVQMSDDGAVFQAFITASNGVATAGATLFVSPLPAVVFQDEEFPLANWTVSATPSSATYVATQAADGGDPGAFRGVSNQMTAGAGVLQLDHFATGAVYDPRTQGAIYMMSLISDCIRISRAEGVVLENTSIVWPIFEQSGRIYRPRNWYGYCQTTWMPAGSGLQTADGFELAAGPPCGNSESCPHFSAAALPMRFGFTSYVGTKEISTAGAVVLGVDNWRATIWRK